MPAGRNVRVSMMVECFGIYMFFSECVLVLGIYVLVLTVVLDYNPTKAHSHTTGMTHLLDVKSH